MDLKEQIKIIAKRNYIDYHGFTPVSRLKNAPPGHRPTDLLIGAKSVIVLGMKIGKGVVGAHKRAYAANMPHAMYPFLLFGYTYLNHILNFAAFEISRFLEDKGFATLPIPAGGPSDPNPLMGALSHKHAAVAAGLGEFGWMQVLLTPEAGPRVRLNSVITEAEIEPSALYNGPRLCDPRKCGFRCVEVCPMNAIPKHESLECKIGGRTIEYSELDKWSCRWGVHGFTASTLGRKDMPKPDKVTPEIYLKALKEQDPWQAMVKTPIGRSSQCSQCQIECPVGS